jgi:hypothetical protein
MMTMDDLDAEAYRRAMASRDDRHWVYHRAGLPCRVCGTEIVLEEMAARSTGARTARSEASMRQNPSFTVTDVAELRRILDENPWMTLVSHGPTVWSPRITPCSWTRTTTTSRSSVTSASRTMRSTVWDSTSCW